MMQWKRKIGNTAATLATVLMITACGGEPYREGSPTGGTTGTDTSGTGGTGTTTTTDNTGSTGSTGGTNPPITRAFTVTGAGGSAPEYTTTVNTDNILKIRVNSATAGQLSSPYGSSYSNFSASYSCIVYQVEALGETITTDPLSVNGGSAACAGAPSEQVIDFSNRLSAGHGPITIKVRAVNYDFYYLDCLSSYSGMNYYMGYWQRYPYGCENPSVKWKTLFKSHTANGSLDIQINGTSL